MQQSTIKLLIANDHKLYRDAQELAISKVPHFQILGEAVSFSDLFEKLKNCRTDIDILITDDVMIKESLLDNIQEIKNLYPRLKIIVTSNYNDPHYLIKIRQETHGLLVGGMITAEEFIKGIEMVSKGENCYWHQYIWHP